MNTNPPRKVLKKCSICKVEVHNRKRCPTTISSNRAIGNTGNQNTINASINNSIRRVSNIEDESDVDSELPDIIEDTDSDNEQMDPILAEIRLNRIEEERQHQFNQQNVQNNIPQTVVIDPFAEPNWQRVVLNERIYAANQRTEEGVLLPPRIPFGGPSNIPNEATKESHFLELFFTEELLALIRDASNACNNNII